ncbi:MAG: glycosyltransferase, partial [Lentisphaerae bacterium]
TTTFPVLTPRVHLIHHGLDLRQWPYSPPEPPQEPLQFLFVGRLVDKKSPQTAVAWVKALDDAGITAQLTIAGDGPLRDQVPTIGIRNPAEIRELMNQAHFLLVPSRQTPDGDREGIPNVILEAMASGLPVIATSSGSISEILTPDTGFLLPDPSPASFVELIRQLILPSSMQQLKRCCEQARWCIEEEFDLSCNIQEKIRIWNRLAATETKGT